MTEHGSPTQVRPRPVTELARRTQSLTSRADALRHHAPGVILGIAIVSYGAWLLHLGSGIWFWADDFEFLLRRGSVDGVDHGLFAPHNGHWSTIVVIIYRTLYATVGMTSYLPYVAITILIHLGITVLIYVLLRRAQAHRWAATLAAWFVLFVPVGFDNILWDATMNNTGALLFGFIAVLLLSRDGGSGSTMVLVWTSLVTALMFSGTGISAVVLATTYTLASWGGSRAVRVASVPALAFVVWYIAEGRAGNSLIWDPGDVPQFVWTGLTKSLGNAIGVPEAGPVLFVVLVLAMLTDHNGRPSVRNLAWAGLVAATCQLLLEAATRGVLGFDVATNGRYAYFTLILLAPAVGAALDQLWRHVVAPRWLVATAGAVLALSYTVHCFGELTPWAEGWGATTRDLRGLILATSETVARGQRPLADDYGIHNLTPELLGRAEVRAKLPQIEVSTADLLRAETEFDVGVSATTYGLFSPVFIDLTSGWKEEDAAPGGGCATYTATQTDPLIQIATQQGTEIGITSDATRLVTVLQRDDALGPIRIWDVEAGAIYIAATAKDAVLRVSFNAPGEYTICKQ